MRILAELAELAIDKADAGGGFHHVVDGVAWQVASGEAVGLVGESGCGKTLSALALLRLVPEWGRLSARVLRLVGEDVLAASEARLCQLRGSAVGFVFQEPASALNPVRRVASQVSEAAELRRPLGRKERVELAETLLAEMGLERPGELARAFPHQLSGGQRQRVMLASALSGNPELLVADEPTSALDTVARAGLVDLLRRLRERRRLSLCVISHDLDLVAALADRIAVIHAGETVETAPRDRLLAEPLHPYTVALLEARIPPGVAPGRRLPVIGGAVPRPREWGRGCRFAPRCPHAWDACRASRPELVALDDGRQVRCFLFGGGAAA